MIFGCCSIKALMMAIRRSYLNHNLDEEREIDSMQFNGIDHHDSAYYHRSINIRQANVSYMYFCFDYERKFQISIEHGQRIETFESR
jgi:hypothetical protein